MPGLRPLSSGSRLALLLPLCLLATACLFSSPTYLAEPEGDVQPVAVEARLYGADSLPESRLRRIIEDRMYDLSRAPEETVVVQDAVLDLEDLYRAQGFPDAEISFRIERPAADDPDRPMQVLFDFDEGRRVVVRRMDLEGARHFEREKLLPLWLRTHAGLFGLGSPYYVADDVRGFASSLRMFYRSEGFLDVDIDEPRVEAVPGTDEVVDVRIDIREGVRYHIGPATLSPELQAALGSAAPTPPTGKVASTRTVADFREEVLLALLETGYPDARLSADLQSDRGKAEVSIHIDGKAGRRARIGEIEVVGNQRTNTDVILSRFDLDSGQVYNGVAIDDGVRALYLTSLFRRVEVKREWADGDPEAEGEGVINLRIEIEEQDSKRIEALAGWGSYERLRGMLRFEENNLFGTGRKFSAELRASTRGARGAISVTDPRIFNTDTSLTVTADAYTREEPSYTDEAWGGTLALQRELLERWTTRFGYTYRKHNGVDIDLIPGVVNVADYLAGNLFLDTRFDLRDSPIYPRDGFQFNIQVDGMDPALGATIQFMRLRFGASAYWPITDDLNIAFRTEQGLLWPGETSADIPLQERFYNGGFNTVRSFQQWELGPKDASGRPLGGDFRNVFSVEARGRVLGSLELAAFADAGNIGTDIGDFGLDDMRYALGLGVRLGLPVGPIRADAGWNPDRREGEDNWVFHFAVGYPF